MCMQLRKQRRIGQKLELPQRIGMKRQSHLLQILLRQQIGRRQSQQVALRAFTTGRMRSQQ
ncbi:hypothetical protein BJP62_10965 [Jeongeupia sp. USM3]|nr:hypothetical protein BJP62_10965 [Jeongeupia sp. USM3]